MATTEELQAAAKANVPAYVDQARIDEINRMYDAYGQSEQNRIQADLDLNLSNLETNRSKIAQEYQTQRNAAATDYERQRRNFNQTAMMNGLNVGAGSQAALAQNNMYQRSQATLGAAEGSAYAELDRSIADMKAKAQADINEAISKNDYNRAAAILDEYDRSQNIAIEKAATLAQYGDFSGYAALYGKDVAKQMETTWLYQNPLIAYTMGKITAAQYKKLTGSDPPGTSRSGGGGYYYRRGRSNTTATVGTPQIQNAELTQSGTFGAEDKPITVTELNKNSGGTTGGTGNTGSTSNRITNNRVVKDITEYNKSQVTMPNKNKVMTRGVGGHSAGGKAKSKTAKKTTSTNSSSKNSRTTWTTSTSKATKNTSKAKKK